MIVICLEGCHGSGKSSLCKQLKDANFNVLDEAFIQQPNYSIHPQSLVMETYWVANWFQRCLDTQLNDPDAQQKIYIVDRSPFSAVFYSQNSGYVLEPLIREQIEEMRQIGIDIYTVNLKVDKEILWNRILDRLEHEPQRKKYNEDSREWMEQTLEFYDTFNWDFTIENNEISIEKVTRQLVRKLANRVPSFKQTLPQNYKLSSPQKTVSAKAAI
eukprot:gb/GECH01001580.1/.p1 GENE.gb/GECH01001580.1/~~gb/GECH01001580.1/.p1  ORF type:complete len:215 (+),score=61.45 gb/GECH01001580.1/:1-645(+)